VPADRRLRAAGHHLCDSWACGENSSLSKRHIDPTRGIPRFIPQDLVEPLLKKLEKTQTFTRRARGFSIGAGAPYISTTLGVTTESGQSQPILAGGDRILMDFFEAYPAWIRCIGRGMFIRLWDNVIEEKDVEAVASLVDKVVKDVLRAKAL